MRRKKLANIFNRVTTGMILKRKMQSGENSKRNVGWTLKVNKCRTSNSKLQMRRDRDAWKIMIAYAKEQGT